MKYSFLAGLLILPILLALPLCSAELTFTPNEPAEIKISCFDVDESFCGAAASCNLTVFAPNMSILIDDGIMTNEINYFNYTTPSLDTRGEYNAVISCEVGGVYGHQDFNFIVTAIPATSQGNVAIGILASLIALSFLFVYIGFKFSDSEQLFPIALFFILLSLIVVVYTLHLGYIYNRDILISASTTGSQFKIYFGIMYGLIGIAFIALLSLIIKTLKEFKVRKSVQQHGEGFNTNKNIYE